jgi:hypothetical protein
MSSTCASTAIRRIFYWWPVWLIGYLFALLTYMQGVPTVFGEGDNRVEVLIHSSRNLGVIFTMTFLLVMMMSHLAVRGLASLTLIITLIAITILFAYLDWWESILHALGSLAIYMNLGFYMFFSGVVFGVWVLALFVFDRLEYWEFRPGQMIHHSVFGSGEQTYDTRGMSVTKLRNDLFRHWILGLGSGDLHIAATGALKADFVVPNVLFVGAKLRRIEQLASMKPDEHIDELVPPARMG